jgi:two-component system sensor histidine kinase/response regulator
MMSNAVRVDTQVVARFNELETVAGMVGLFLETVSDFETHGQDRLTSIRTALSAGDEATLHREAHTLKGGAGTLGAVRLREVAQAMEEAARSGDMAAAATILPSLETEFVESVAALRAAAPE